MTDETIEAPKDSPILKIPVPKAKAEIELDYLDERLPSRYYIEAVKLGFKAIINGGTEMSKLTKATHPKEEELRAAALAVANKRCAEMLAGTLKLGVQRGATKGEPHAVMIEARRLARDIVKGIMKEKKIRQAAVSASQITQWANEVIEAQPDLIEVARQNIANRDKVSSITLLKSEIKEDPKKVAELEAEKAERKLVQGPLSAIQAGKAKRGKVAARTAVH